MSKRVPPKKSSKEKEDRREPAEIRAEEFRVAAQRETVEAFVVAFILALLFRAFLAEAFVIPTGSMAPTLMGAHKDLVCDQCGTSFQVGASRERSGPETNLVVVAGVCPNCRRVNPLDLADEGNHATFNGDRILVSKYSYALREPERWDVIVFKYPGNPKQNYIKRLVGLPNETLTIRHGDVYARPTGEDQRDVILRKPPRKLLSMRHLVYDSDHQPQALIRAGYPSRWQPWIESATEPPQDSWRIERSSEGLIATLQGEQDKERFQWLRYYHRWPSDSQWRAAIEGDSLASVDPYESRAITDFYAYDSYVNVPARYVYDEPPSMRRGTRLERMMGGGYSSGKLNRRYLPGVGPEQFNGAVEWGGQDSGRDGLGRDGMHWVGDLMLESDVETSSGTSELMMELVEAGVKFRCRIDLESGEAELSINDVDQWTFSQQEGVSDSLPRAQTSVRSGSRHELRFSNCDDQLLLWVDGDVVEFDRPTTFDSRKFRPDETNHPHYLATHPLDAAPAAVGVRDGESTIRSLRVFRDKYYIATKNSNFGIHDYNMNKLNQLAGGRSVSLADVQQVFAMREDWSNFVGWEARRRVSFPLEADQFFPMGDNSPESLDARCWAGTKTKIPLPRGVNRDAWAWSDESYVPRDLLVGKALVVFWPHSWNSPVPFVPNFKRMKIIR